MESQLHSADRASQSFEGDISLHSATLCQPVNEGEDVYDDEGYTDYEYDSDGGNEVKYDEEQKSELDVNAIAKPHIGMTFNSVEDAYQFYKKYGGEMGFGVRRGSSRRSRRDNVLIWRELLCNREGWRRKRDEATIKKHRGETRTGCRAKLVVKLQSINGTWAVTVFDDNHNHKFDILKTRQVLRTQRNTNPTQGDLIPGMCKEGVLTNFTVNFLSEEIDGSRGVQNDVHTERKMDYRKEDAQPVLNYFNDMQAANPNFFYAIKLDANGQLSSLFWADAISRMDYNYFGDVVSFDASYGTDRYKIPFIPIFGVNHHLQITYFGGAIILNETTASYVWVLETWMKLMRRNLPKTILTDQDSAMSEAISQIFPYTPYCYCLWDIFENAQKHLEHLYKQNCSFAKDFSSCIYNSEIIEEFEENWETLLTTYNLHANEWMTNLYGKRQQWVPVYSKDIFCAGMTTKQCCESINKFFKDFLKSDMLLHDFVKAIDKALLYRREKELRADFNDNYVHPCLRVYMHIEEDAGNLYTKTAFEQFQNELLMSLRYMSEKVEVDGTKSTFRCWIQNTGHIVKLFSDDSSAKCSCQKFEHAGILCRHILKVYSVTNVVKIPPKFVLKRWTKNAKCGFVVREEGEQLQEGCQIPLSVRCSSLCHQGMNIAAKAASSMEVYKVAKHWLGKTLDEVENAFRRISLESMGSNGDEAEMSDIDCSVNHVSVCDQLLVKDQGQPGTMEVRFDENHNWLPICEINGSRSNQCQSEHEIKLDLPTEKKRKNTEMPTSNKKDRSLQHQEDEKAKEGTSVSTVILEAPNEQTSSRPVDDFGTCFGVNKLDIHRFSQGTSLTTMQLLDSFYLQRDDAGASAIQLNQFCEENSPSEILGLQQFHDNTNVEPRHPCQGDTT